MKRYLICFCLCQVRLDAMITAANIINIANYSLYMALLKGVFYFSKTALFSCYTFLTSLIFLKLGISFNNKSHYFRGEKGDKLFVKSLL